MGQAKAIGDALDALPIGLDRGQRVQAEQLILKEAEHAPAEKLRTMTEQILQQVAPEQTASPEQRAAKLEERDRRARHRRTLWFGPETDGSIAFGGSLPIVAGRRSQGMVPEFLPPEALDPARTPIPRVGHTATLFDHDRHPRAG